MQRFLMLVGVAVVAAAMYVAASPASQQAQAPSTKQFNALKKQVATLTKTLKTVKAEANDADGFVRTCLISSGAGLVPVNQFGTTTDGFLFGAPTGTPTARTALDVDMSTTPGAFVVAIDPACVQSSTTSHAQRHAGSGRLLLYKARVR
jgi:hypothetical protein